MLPELRDELLAGVSAIIDCECVRVEHPTVGRKKPERRRRKLLSVRLSVTGEMADGKCFTFF